MRAQLRKPGTCGVLSLEVKYDPASRLKCIATLQRRLDRRSRAQFNQSPQRIYICASQQKQSQGNKKALEFAYFSRSVCKFSSIEMHILAHFDVLLNILRLLSGKCQYCFCISCLNGSLHSHTCKQTLCVSATFT